METMEKWVGAAAVCINSQNELLMVKQGKQTEAHSWSVPSGGLERNETFEECCIRELYEETGYIGHIKKPLFVKEADFQNIDVVVHYYLVDIIGGKMTIQDPDQLIHAIAWQSRKDIEVLYLSFPEDREFLHHMLQQSECL